MPKKHSKESLVSLLKQTHGDIVEIDFSTYTGTRNKALFIDRDYGDWWATPNNVIHHGKSHPIRGRLKQEATNLFKFGYKNPFFNKEVQKKIKQTNLFRYGVENAFKSPIVREKWRNTMLKKYGVSHPLKQKSAKESVSKKNSVNRKKVLKAKQTSVQKYGCDNPMKNRSISLKSAKNSNRSFLMFHWKTNEELVCVGSYEKKVIEWLNDRKLDFLWQPNVFVMPDGRTYRPDLYFVEKDCWVEIKGYFRKDAKEKWDWFRSQYLNSELWDRAVLKKKGIL